MNKVNFVYCPSEAKSDEYYVPAKARLLPTLRNFLPIVFILFVLTPLLTMAGAILFEIPDWFLVNDASWGRADSTAGTKIAVQFDQINPGDLSGACAVSEPIAQTGNPDDDVVMDVYDDSWTNNPAPTGPRIAHVSIKGSDLPTNTSSYTTFQLDHCPDVTPGHFFWFVLSRSDPNGQGEYLAKRSQGNYIYWTSYWYFDSSLNKWVTDDYKDWGFRLETGDAQPQSKEPVIIIPGIMGSYLNRASDGKEVWPNVSEMVKPGSDTYLDDLKLSSSSNEIIDIDSGDIIKQISIKNFYGALIDKFKNEGYVEGKDLIIFPYDWRLDLLSTTSKLKDVINAAASSSPTGKVNIVAHSMGGLVVKEYLKQNQQNLQKLNNVVIAGSPQLGAVRPFKLLNFGDDLGFKFLFFGLNSSEAKSISQNMPSVYQLLPSREYLNNAGSYVEDYRNGQNKLLNYDEINSFMLSDTALPDHRNQSLINLADSFHQNLDGLNVSGPTITNIVGCSVDTLGKIKLYDKNKVKIDTVKGDGSVPLISAEQIFSDKNQINYYAKGMDHLGLVSNSEVLSFVNYIITGQDPGNTGDISKSETICQTNKKFYLFSTHSPVNLKVSDSQGNYVGLDSNGDVNLGIPESNFLQIGENNFALVPEGNGYAAQIDAYATGSFDFNIEAIDDNGASNSAVFLDVPIQNQNLKASLSFDGQFSSISLNVDQDGNGVVDSVVKPDSINADPKDSMPPEINILSPVSTNYIRSSLINISIQLTDAESGIAKSEYYLDGKIFNSNTIDPFFYSLGEHKFEVSAYDKAGNLSTKNVSFKTIATTDSTISDVDRIYSLGWIKSKKIRNSLVNKLDSANRTKDINKKRKILIQFCSELDTDYSDGLINNSGYVILKDDVNWLLNF